MWQIASTAALTEEEVGAAALLHVRCVGVWLGVDECGFFGRAPMVHVSDCLYANMLRQVLLAFCCVFLLLSFRHCAQW